MKRHKIYIETLFIDEILFIHALIKISIRAKFDIVVYYFFFCRYSLRGFIFLLLG